MLSLEIGTRGIVHWDLSTLPDEAWVAQQFRNLSPVSDDLPRYLIHDRDSKYTRHADALLEDAGTKVIRLPVNLPNLPPDEFWNTTTYLLPPAPSLQPFLEASVQQAD